MTVNDEPVLYLDNLFGVRTENTMLITPYMETEFGRFLQMEPLTLCPIDTEPIILEMMKPEEIEWLNEYHKRVYEELSPLLEDKEWLREKTLPLTPPIKGGE